MEPRFEVTEDDPGTVVRSRNGTRRHLTTGQLAFSYGKSLVLDNKRVNGRWVRGSVVNPESGINDGKTWQNALIQVGVVFDHAPDLYEPGRDGALALDAAYQRRAERRGRRPRRRGGTSARRRRLNDLRVC